MICGQLNDLYFTIQLLKTFFWRLSSNRNCLFHRRMEQKYQYSWVLCLGRICLVRDWWWMCFGRTGCDWTVIHEYCAYNMHGQVFLNTVLDNLRKVLLSNMLERCLVLWLCRWYLLPMLDKILLIPRLICSPTTNLRNGGLYRQNGNQATIQTLR